MKMTDVIKQPMLMARKKITGDTGPISATDLLTMQHREVDMLFLRLKRSDSGREKRTLVRELADKLAAHMLIEHEIFYPACRDEADARPMVLESFEEHGVALHELERLVATSTADVTFDAKLEVLRELVQHHAKDEENELFPKARKAFDRARMMQLGARMNERFERALAKGAHDTFASRLESRVEQNNPARTRRVAGAAAAPRVARTSTSSSTSRRSGSSASSKRGKGRSRK